VEDVLSCVNQKIQGLHKELTKKIVETQVDLHSVKTSIDMWTGSLKNNITDTKEDFYEAIVNTRNDLHEELILVLQVEA
jgi:hypothetical protein